MRRIGDDHLGAFVVAARLVVGVHDQHAGEFSVRARGGLERNSREAADLFQPFLQCVHQREIALHGLDGLERMRDQETRQAAGVLVDLRVVLHRAGAERIEAAVHRVVEFAEVHVVAHNVHFGEFGQGQVRAE